MYPVVRLTKEFIKFRNAPDLPPLGEHVSTHMCMPWDIDLWRELNNGRTLTIYDLGRLVLAKRIRLIGTLKRQHWNLTMAGAMVRYRRRVRIFETITMRSRALCWDDKFVYIEQSMWKADGECANHIVYRAATVGKNGIVAPEQVMQEMGMDMPDCVLPDWIASWIETEALRPWPPMQG
ncbi:MAG: thioeseterase [Rhodobacterales bacterium]|nr:MAG: thioeseterase [Rhodobacterales bacterium]